MITNPFVFGKVVKGKNFCNRTQKIETILQATRSQSSLIIVSPRRYGKTSLVINALEKHNIPFLFIDCFEISSEKQFLERLLGAYFQALRKGDILDKIKYWSKTVSLEYSFTLKGIQIRLHQYHDTALRTVLGEVTKEHLLVLDEFQDLFTTDPALVKSLRSILQFLPRCSIFLGSKKHLLLYLFSDQRSPFYNFGSIMNLGKIPAAAWHTFIKSKFSQTKLTISDAEVTQLLDYAELIPFYVQYLCYYYWQDKAHKKTDPLFFQNIIAMNAHVYEELYEKLPASQKAALRILLKGEKLFSAAVAQEYQLSTQALNKAFTALVEKGFLDKNGGYQFIDPLFKRYVLGMV